MSDGRNDPAGMIGVHHEWGRLREVVLGNTADADALSAMLEGDGVVVHRVDQPSVRDPLIVVGHHAIEASFRKVARRQDCLAVRPLLQEAAFRRDATWIAVPQGSPNEADGPYLEGGDVLLDGRNVYVGMSGRASDLAGADWLGALLGREYKVLAIPLRSDVEHLEDVLTLVRPGLLICCREKLVDGLPSALAAWDMIAISKEEAAQRTSQTLILDQERVIVAAQNARVITELRARRMDVMPLGFERGLRAAYHPLLRESILE
jgi:N-dimethylarginine dimethylaminohydrolase